VNGCLPCICGKRKLISDIFIRKKTIMKIKCISCGYDGVSGKNIEEAVFLWNKKITEERYGK